VPKKPPVVVIDTNILISYLFGGTTITSLIDAVEDDAYLPALSPYLEQEFVDTMRKPKISRRVDIADALDFMREWKNFANYVTPRCRVTRTTRSRRIPSLSKNPQTYRQPLRFPGLQRGI
jgi:predicted nucleic acid-binding protein